jgi:hypothetical protein
MTTVNKYVRYSSQSNLRDTDVIDMREKYRSSNASIQEIAELFGVNRSTVERIISHRTWSHIPSPTTIKNGRYSVYPDGRIWSTASKKFLTPRTTASGIPQVQLSTPTGKETVPVALLVAKTFISPNVRSMSSIAYANADTMDTHFINLSVKTKK